LKKFEKQSFKGDKTTSCGTVSRKSVRRLWKIG